MNTILKDWQKVVIGLALAGSITLWLLLQVAKDPTFQPYTPPGEPKFRIVPEEPPNLDQ